MENASGPFGWALIGMCLEKVENGRGWGYMRVRGRVKRLKRLSRMKNSNSFVIRRGKSLLERSRGIKQKLGTNLGEVNLTYIHVIFKSLSWCLGGSVG